MNRRISVLIVLSLLVAAVVVDVRRNWPETARCDLQPDVWQLREYRTWADWCPDFAFLTPEDSLLSIDSARTPEFLGCAYVFRTFRRSDLDGKKIQVRWNAYFTYHVHYNLQLLTLWVIDHPLNRTDQTSYFADGLNREPIFDYTNILCAVHPGPYRVGWTGWSTDSGSVLDLSSWSSEYVTILIRTVDAWVQQSVVGDIDWLKISDANDNVLDLFDFSGPAQMEVLETYHDYGLYSTDWSKNTLFTLTIETASGGTTSPPPGQYTLFANSTINVSANPDRFFALNEWLLDGSDGGSANPLTIMMDGNHTLKAVFTRLPTCYLRIETTSGGTTNPRPGEYLLLGNSTVNVSADPDYYFAFDGWLLDGSDGGSANPLAITMDGNHTLKAVFTRLPTCYLTLLPSADGTVFAWGGRHCLTGPGVFAFPEGSRVSVGACPSDQCHVFHHLLIDQTNVSNANLYSFTITENHTVEAFFSDIPQVVYIDPGEVRTELNSRFTVYVKLANISNLYGLDLQFTWDPTIIKCVDHQKHIPVETYSDGVLHSGTLVLRDQVDESANIEDSEQGTRYWLAEASLLPAQAFDGDGIIVEMTFEVVGIGNSQLRIVSCSLSAANGDPLATRTQDGTVASWWNLADVNHDLRIDILDIAIVTSVLGTIQSDPNWNPYADIAEPYGKIDILDVVKCTGHYGQKYP